MTLYSFKNEKTGLYIGVEFRTIKEANAYVDKYYADEKEDLKMYSYRGNIYHRVVNK